MGMNNSLQCITFTLQHCNSAPCNSAPCYSHVSINCQTSDRHMHGFCIRHPAFGGKTS